MSREDSNVYCTICCGSAQENEYFYSTIIEVSN